MKLSRREFIKALGMGVATIMTGGALTGCQIKTNDEAKTERTEEYFTATGEVEYFEPGTHVISVCVTAEEEIEQNYTTNYQVEVPEGYELVSTTSSSNKTNQAQRRYFANNVPVEAEIYITSEGKKTCPYPGTPVELENENENTLVKKQ